jgi:serine phosphatase RsbU (regulator of sigma subunit)/putative methionine-R-sulfoxide reductase with GAF domain
MEAASRVTGNSVRLEALFGFGGRMAAADGEADVLEVMVADGSHLAGAAAAVVGIVEGPLVRVAASTGYPPGYLDPWEHFPLEEGFPMSDVIASRRPVYCSSRAERDERWPRFRGTGNVDTEAFVVLPLAGRAELLGALTLSYHDERGFDAEERAFLEALATQCALAFERARASELERRLRSDLEFVAGASKALSHSLDLEQTLDAIGGLVVPRLADWFACDLLRTDGIELVAAVHVDPAKVERARELRERFPVGLDDGDGLAVVLRTGEPLLYETITDAMLAEAAGTAEHRELLEELGLSSAMVVPLVARDRILGALSFVAAESERRYDRQSLSLAEELAARVAIAIDNAALYRAQNAAYESERVARERTQRLQRFTARLAPALTVDAVAEIAVDKALVASRGVTAFLALAADDGSGLELRRLDGRVPDEMRAVTFVPRDHASVAGEVLRTKEPLWLRNRAEWESFPAAIGRPPFLRSAAILPVSGAGRFFGVLGIAYDHERDFPDDERAFLSAIAGQTAQALDRARLHEEQRHIAHVLQESLLPRDLPVVPGVQLAAAYEAAGALNEVGGDFYDVFEAGGDHVVVVGDVCGKGPEAAALTALCRYTLRAHTTDPDFTPAQLLGHLNRAIVRQSPGADRFATIVCARLRAGAGRVSVTLASAGHPPALIRRHGGAVEAGETTGPVVGIFEEATYGEQEVELEAGDLVFLYTDGLVDARSPGGGRLGEPAIREAIAKLPPDGDADDAIAAARRLAEGLEVTDDIAVVALSVA